MRLDQDRVLVQLLPIPVLRLRTSSPIFIELRDDVPSFPLFLIRDHVRSSLLFLIRVQVRSSLLFLIGDELRPPPHHRLISLEPLLAAVSSIVSWAAPSAQLQIELRSPRLRSSNR